MRRETGEPSRSSVSLPDELGQDGLRATSIGHRDVGLRGLGFRGLGEEYRVQGFRV